MYYPTPLITEEILKNILESFEWPEAFELENEMPDGIVVAFPNSHFCYVEGMGGRISVEFLPEDTFEDYMRFTIQDALEMLAPHVNTRGYDFFDLPGPQSIEKVEEGIRRCTALIHEHLLDVVRGDFNWVAEAKRKRVIKK